MTSNLHNATILKYGVIWEFFRVADPARTRPVIDSPPIKTEISSTFFGQSPDNTGIMAESVFPDENLEQTGNSQILEQTSDKPSISLEPCHDGDQMENWFYTPRGRSGIIFPDSILPFPGENPNILLYRVNSYITLSYF